MVPGHDYDFSCNAATGLLLRQIAALPHIIVLCFLGIAAFVLWVVVQWVILFTARFPRGMFDFVAGVVRWQTRVNGYALGLSDRYPPFSLEAPTDRARASAPFGTAPSRTVVRGPHRPPRAPLLGRHPMDAERGRRREDRH